jgi:hypothetical protein
MADITMCHGVKASSHYTICPKRERCYRYKAVENEQWQSWAFFDFEGEICENFWELDEDEKGAT